VEEEEVQEETIAIAVPCELALDAERSQHKGREDVSFLCQSVYFCWLCAAFALRFSWKWACFVVVVVRLLPVSCVFA
jgi:hypothetical protein